MTRLQIKWASQHDWFVFADYDNGTVCVLNENGTRFVWTQSFAALRTWAGY